MPVEIEKAKKLAKEELIKKIPCVVGVSAHHSKPVIRIYVEKLDPSVLKELPQVFLGYQVQVIEVGRVEALIDRKLRYRPLFPGISIGSELVTAGTLSQVCVDNKTGEYCLLSNRHVFWGDRGTAVLQPGSYDGGHAPEDVVGYITRYEEIKYEDNIIDAAVCSLEVEATNKDPELGQPARIGEVNEGDKVYKVGRTTGFTSAKVLDSVPGYSPVLIKCPDKKIEIIPIEELWLRIKGKVYKTKKGEEIKIVDGYWIFSNMGWTKIKKIIRHKYKGKILRFNTRGGIVDVTPNHSLILTRTKRRIKRDRKGRFKEFISVVNANNVDVGDGLAMPKLLIKNYGGKGIQKRFFVGSNELAWLLGFFVGDGSACIHRNPRKTYEVNFVNKNEKILEKVSTIFRENFHEELNWSENENGVSRLYTRNKFVYEYFRQFYTIHNEKTIPKFILNAPEEIQLSFLRGYNDADGYSKTHKKRNYEFKCFTTTSQTLAMGLLWLIANTTKQPYKIYTRNDKPNVIQIHFCKNKEKEIINNKWEVIRKIELDYSGYVYDIETNDNTFTTGVGPIRVHNTAATLKVYGYQNVGEAIFDDVIVTTASSAPGDSGSPCFSEKGELVGLVFAGSEKITVICKAKHVVNRLNITPIYGAPFVRAGVGLPILAMAAIPVASYYFAKGGRI